MDSGTVNYEEPPEIPSDDSLSKLHTARLLQDVLCNRVNFEAARVKEAETLFGGISALIDKHNNVTNQAALLSTKLKFLNASTTI